MGYGWKTEMYPDEHPECQGQAAATVLDDGRLVLHAMPAPHTFAATVTLSPADREALRAYLNGDD